MSNFTKGKWEVDRTGFDIEITCGDMYLASMYNLEHLEETEANARLIAAAPEMYDELYEILQFMKGKTLWERDEYALYEKDIEELLERIDGVKTE